MFNLWRSNAGLVLAEAENAYFKAAEVLIHTPCEGSDDLLLLQHQLQDRHISIHAPRGGSDTKESRHQIIYLGGAAMI